MADIWRIYGRHTADIRLTYGHPYIRRMSAIPNLPICHGRFWDQLGMFFLQMLRSILKRNASSDLGLSTLHDHRFIEIMFKKVF